MKYTIAVLIICLTLTSHSLAANRYYDNSDWRDFPFIEMMAAMFRIMNDMVGSGSSSYYYPGLGMLPYSPAMMNGMTGMNSFPMSPSGINTSPMQNLWFDSLNKNTGNVSSYAQKNNWLTNKNQINFQDMNGIWQALTGDVLAIYHNNHFIWSDGNSRNLAGRLMIQGNQMTAYIPASKTTLKFKFYQENGQFIVQDQNSRIYTFKKIH